MINQETQSIMNQMKSFITTDRANLARAVEFNLSKQFEKLYEKLDADKNEIINLISKKK